jgi:ribosomal-protein-alanine N-acetyltransferase
MSDTKEKSTGPGFDYIELAGEKVRLRPTEAGDAEAAFDFITREPDLSRFMLWSGPKSVDELRDTYSGRWREEMRQGTSYPLAIEKRGIRGIIGCIDLRPAAYPGQFDFGYWLAKPFWNLGYTAEALGLICYLAFHHLDAGVVLGSAFTGNAGSRRVMEKNGFKLEGVLRSHVKKDGEWVDLWHLSLLRNEWLQSGIRPVAEKLVPHMEDKKDG